MPIDASIPRSAFTGLPDIGQKFARALGNVQTGQKIAQQREQAPIRNQLLQSQADVADNQAAISDRNRRIGSLAEFGLTLDNDLNTGNLANIRSKTLRRLESLPATGAPDSNDSTELLQLIDNPNLTDEEKIQEIGALKNQAVSSARQFGLLKSPTGTIGAQKFIGTPQRVQRDVVNPDTGETESQNFLVGVSQKVDGSFGLQEVPVEGEFVSTLGETGEKQTNRLIREVGGKETAKLSAQLKLEPAVKSAVASAVGNVRQLAEDAQTSKSNATALNVYEAGVNGLSSALHDTSTGPFAGFVPAITANQQIANGAVAAMAPILKQMFRSAGEGNFTDSDQKLLLDMIPTRKDRPAARVAKLQNIDAIVRAKLNLPPEQSQPDQQQPVQAEQPQQAGGIKFLGFE